MHAMIPPTTIRVRLPFSFIASGWITSGFTGHERESNHFTPARMSAPRATLCYPAFRDQMLGEQPVVRAFYHAEFTHAAQPSW